MTTEAERRQEAIVGDWTGEREKQRDRAIDDLAELRSRVRATCMYALGRRAYWALEGSEIGAARAVAYQSIAGQLIVALATPTPDPP